VNDLSIGNFSIIDIQLFNHVLIGSDVLYNILLCHFYAYTSQITSIKQK